LLVLGLGASVFLLHPSASLAGTFTTFGETFQRGTGAPVTVMRTFSVPNPATTYTLRVDNGGFPAGQLCRVSSAIVDVNGVHVIRTSDLSQNIATVERSVSLSRTNLLTVELRSDPGCGITLRIIGMNNTPPVITAAVSPPANAAGWNNTDVHVSFTCTDAISGVARCPDPVTVSAEGAGQVVSGTAVDVAGNQSNVSVTLNIDKSRPAVSAVVSPPANAAGWNSTDVRVSFTCTDAVSGIARCPDPVTVSTDGAGQVVSGVATDLAGNQATASVTLNVDKTAPVVDVAVSPPPNAAGWNNGTVTVTFTCRDAASGVALCPAPVIVTGDGAGQVISGRALDVAGNQSTASVTLNIDKTAPIVQITIPADGSSVNSRRVRVSGSVNDANALASITVNGTAVPLTGNTFSTELQLDEGPQTITVEALDLAGNRGVKTVGFRVAIPPVLTITSPVPGATVGLLPLTVSGTLDDPTATVVVNGVAASVTGGAFAAVGVPVQAGPNTLTATATDPFGNVGTASVQVIAANQPPTADPGGPYSADAGQVITFDGSRSTDPDKDALTFAWDFGDGTTGAGARPSHAYRTTGSYRVTLTVNDGRGGTHTASTTVTIVDRTPPVLTVTAPREVLPGSQVTVTVQATDNVAVDSVTFEVNGADPLRVTSPPYQRVVSVPSVASVGQIIRVTATARDTSGNTASAEATLTISALPDTENPVVTLNAPSEAAAGTTLHLSAGATDNVGVASVVFSVNGMQIGKTTAPPYEATYSIPTETPTGTSLTVSVQAADFSGNTAEAQATVTIAAVQDTTPPTVKLAAPAQVVVGGTLRLSATASDNVGVFQVAFSVDGVQVGVATAAPYEAQFALPPEKLAGATVHVEAQAKDFAGLVASDAADVAVVAAPPPGGGVVAGRVYDDTTGLPVTGASAQLVSLDGAAMTSTPPIATTDARGRFRLANTPGAAAIHITAPGFTSADRVVQVVDARRADPFDARLTPLDPTQSVVSSITGAVVTNQVRTISLTLAPGALSSDQTFRVTRVSPQGVAGRTPLGWSPVDVVDIAPADVTFSVPAVLSLPAPNGLPVGTPLVLARWTMSAGAWIAAGDASVSPDGKAVAATVSGTGQYAVLLADASPGNPPAAVVGQAVPAVLTNPPPATVTAFITPSPRVIFPQPGASSQVGVLVVPPSRLSSGAAVRLDLAETFDFVAGNHLFPDPAGQDLALYSFGAGTPLTLMSEAPVTPSHSLPLATFKSGVIDLAVSMPLDRGAPQGTVIGPAGGTATTSDAQLIVPAGAATENLPVVLSSLASAQFPAPIPAGLTLVGVVQVDLHGGALGVPATLSIPTPVGLAAGAQVLVTQLREVSGVSYLVLVGVGVVQNGVLAVAIDPIGDGSVAFPGVLGEGRYAFLRADVPLGFVAGVVTGIDGRPLAGSVVTADTLGVVALADTKGHYVLAAALGDVHVTAVDPTTGDLVTQLAHVTTPGGVSAVGLSVAPTPPTVVAISPANGARNIAFTAPVAVTFSEPLDPASVGTGALTLTKSGALVSGTLSLSPAGTVLTFRPDTLLDSAGSYQVTVAATVKDLVGRPMGAPFVSQFTTLNVTPPPAPAAGALSASIPDASGKATVSGTQGTAVPGGSVNIKNVANGAITTLTPNADGSFSGQVTASPADKLELTIIDADGNKTTVAVPAFRNADGSVVVGAVGGRVEGPGGVVVDIPAGALPEGTVVKVDPAVAADLPIAPPPNFLFVGGVRLSLGGVTASAPLSLSVRAPADATADDQVLVAQVVQLPRRQAWTVVDRAQLEGPNYRDGAPVFQGVLAQGSYAFLRTTYIVTAGPNGVLDSIPAGDDVIAPRPGLGSVIASGPNGQLETVRVGDDGVQIDCVSYVSISYQFRFDVVLVGLGMPFVFPSTTASVATMPAVCGSQLEIQVQDPGTGDVIEKIQQLAAALKDQVVTVASPLTDDHTPPLIVGTNNPTGQNVNQIEVRFSEPMKPASVQQNLVVKDSSGKPVSGKVDLLDSDTRAVFRPDPNSPLRLGEKYTVTLTGATDVAGNQLQSEPIIFTPFEPSSLSAFRDIAQLRDALAKCSGTACDPSLSADCFGAGCTTSATDVAYIDNTLFVASGATSSEQQYRDPANPPKRLLAVDVTNPLQPVLLGFSTTATNPRALATVTNASFVLPGGGLFSGNLLVVAGGGRVAGGELAAKVEVYDVGRCTQRPVNTALNCLEGGLRGFKLLSTPTGVPPQPGIPPDSGVPLQVAVLHDRGQVGPAADRIFAYVATAGIGLQAVDVVQAFANDVPEGLLRGDFLDVAVVKNKLITVKIDSNATPIASVLTAGLDQITDIPPPAGLSKLPGAARVAVGENMFFDLNGNGQADVSESGVPLELFDLAVVSSGALTDGCPTSSVPCGELDVVDLSPLTLGHGGSVRVIARIPMPGPAFSMQVDPTKQLVYVEIRGQGLAVVDLSHLLFVLKTGTTEKGLADANNDGRDDRVLRIIARTDILLTRVKVDTARGLAFINGASSGLNIVQVSNECVELALDFKDEAPPEKDLKKEKEILRGILLGADAALKAGGILDARLLEQGSGSCFWRPDFPAGCTSFQAGISDHDIEVFVPQHLVETAQGILDDFVRSRPKGIGELGDLSLFAVAREPFENDQELLIGTPVRPGGVGDPTGHLGMGLQTLLVLWLLEGDYVTGFEGRPLDAVLTGLKNKPATNPVIPGEPSGIPRLEGLEFAMLQEFNFYNSGALLRIKGACDSFSPAETVSPARFSDLDPNDPARNSDEEDALGEGCQEVLHTVGKSAIRATLGRLVADDAANPLVLDIDRASYRKDACLTGVADVRQPPADPNGYTPKACGSFEEYIVSVAVRSVLKGQGVFSAAQLPQIFTFYCIKVGRKCVNRDNVPIDGPYFSSDPTANAFIAGAIKFTEDVEGQAGAVYFQTLPSDLKLVGDLPFLSKIAGICAKLGIPIDVTSFRSDLRSCNRRIVLQKINGDPSFITIPTSPADSKKKLGVKNFIARNLQVRALNNSAGIAEFTVRMYEGDGLSAAGYTPRVDYNLALAGGRTRVIDVEEDPPGSGKTRPIFPQGFDLTKLAPNQPRAIAFFADPDRRLPEGDRTDNLAAYFYYVLDRNNTAGPPSPPLPTTPRSPVKDMSPDPLCTEVPSLRLVFTVQRAGASPGPGSSDLAVTLGDQIKLNYTVRNGGKQNLTDIQVFRQGNAAPVVTLPQLAPGTEQPGQNPDVITPATGTSVVQATAVAKDPKGNTVASLPAFITLKVDPPPCEADIAALDPDPNPVNGIGLPVSTVMQGGSAFRYYQVRRNGQPWPSATVNVKITKPSGEVINTTATTLSENTDSPGVIFHVPDLADPVDLDIRGLRIDVDLLGSPKPAVGDELLVELGPVLGAVSTCSQRFTLQVQDRTFSRAVRAGASLEVEGAIGLKVRGKQGFGLDFSLTGIKDQPRTFGFGRSVDAQLATGVKAAAGWSVNVGGDGTLEAQAGVDIAAVLMGRDRHEFAVPLDQNSQLAAGELLAGFLVDAALSDSPGGPLLSLVVNELVEQVAGLDQYRTSIGFSAGVEASASAGAEAALSWTNTGFDFFENLGLDLEAKIGLRAGAFAGLDFLPKTSELRPSLEYRAEFDLKAAAEAALSTTTELTPEEKQLVAPLQKALEDALDLSVNLAGKVRFTMTFDIRTGDQTAINMTVSQRKKYGLKILGETDADFEDQGDGIVRAITFTLRDRTKFAEALARIAAIHALSSPAVRIVLGPSVVSDQVVKLLRLFDAYEQTAEDGKSGTLPFGLDGFFGGGVSGQLVLNTDRSVTRVTERGVVKQRAPPGKAKYKLERYPTSDPTYISPVDSAVEEVFDTLLPGVRQKLTAAYKTVKTTVAVGAGVLKTLLPLFFSPSGVELLVDGAPEPVPFDVAVIGFTFRPTAGPAASTIQQPADISGPADRPHYGIGGFFQFTPDGRPLAVPGQLTIHYLDSETTHLDESSLAIYRWNPARLDWDHVGGAVDVVARTVTATVSSLGLYTVAPAMPAGTITFTTQVSPGVPGPNPTTIVRYVSEPIRLNNGQLVPDGTLFTARIIVPGTTLVVPLGTIQTPDADPLIDGVQVASQGGVIRFTAELPGTSGAARVLVNPTVGTALSSQTIPYVQP